MPTANTRSWVIAGTSVRNSYAEISSCTGQPCVMSLYHQTPSDGIRPHCSPRPWSIPTRRWTLPKWRKHKLFAVLLANVNSRPRSLFAVARPSVCLSYVTFVRRTQAVQIFGNISTALGTLAIPWHPLKTSRRSSQGNPSAGGVKHKRGSQV